MAKIAKYNLLGLNLGEGTYSITARAKASGFNPSPESEAVSYRGAYTLDGTWVFNKTIYDNAGGFSGTVKLRFSSNGQTYSSIRIEHQGFGYNIYYDDTQVASGTGVRYTGFFDDAHRTITILGKQTVPDNFYKWFTAKAVGDYAIQGIWRFNAVLDIENMPDQEVWFASNGFGNYYRMLGDTDYTDSNGITWHVLVYNDTVVYRHNAYGTVEWTEDAYMTVEFYEEQTVSSEFANWLAANAKYLGGGTEEPETQTLTVINSNNPSETASFTMPEGYTFGALINSPEYNVGGAFSVVDNAIARYNDIPLEYSDGSNAYIADLASGTFYYAGEAEQTYTLSGTWVLKRDIYYTGNVNERIIFSSNGTDFIGVVANRNGIAYGITDDDYIEVYTQYGWISNNYRIVDFGSTPQTVSQAFYVAFTTNAVQEIIGGNLLFNERPTIIEFSSPNIIFTSANYMFSIMSADSAPSIKYFRSIDSTSITVWHYNQTTDEYEWLNQEYRTLSNVYFQRLPSNTLLGDALCLMFILDNTTPI